MMFLSIVIYILTAIILIGWAYHAYKNNSRLPGLGRICKDELEFLTAMALIPICGTFFLIGMLMGDNHFIYCGWTD